MRNVWNLLYCKIQFRKFSVNEYNIMSVLTFNCMAFCQMFQHTSGLFHLSNTQLQIKITLLVNFSEHDIDKNDVLAPPAKIHYYYLFVFSFIIHSFFVANFFFFKLDSFCFYTIDISYYSSIYFCKYM